jgi:hypothetical protein
LTPDACDALAAEGKLDASLVAPDDALGLPRVRLTAVQARRVSNGGDVPVGEARGELEKGPPPRPGDRVAALSPDGSLLAVMELRPDRRLHPLRVIPTA